MPDLCGRPCNRNEDSTNLQDEVDVNFDELRRNTVTHKTMLELIQWFPHSLENQAQVRITTWAGSHEIIETSSDKCEAGSRSAFGDTLVDFKFVQDMSLYSRLES